MENCSTKPVCQSTAHQDCQANAVQPMNFKFIHICYLNDHNLFGTKGVKHTEGFCDLHACMVLFLFFFFLGFYVVWNLKQQVSGLPCEIMMLVLHADLVIIEIKFTCKFRG